jgi:hypothetical protein
MLRWRGGGSRFYTRWSTAAGALELEPHAAKVNRKQSVPAGMTKFEDMRWGVIFKLGKGEGRVPDRRSLRE